jgi:hypothetical protein
VRNHSKPCDTPKMVAQLDEFRSAMDEDDVRQFASDFFIPLDVHPEAPDVDACDKAKNEPLLRGHLSPELNLFDQILP